MTPTKLLIGQILVVFAIVLAGIWFATQWAAAELAYQAELGTPWAVIDCIPVYRPWAIFLWWYHFDAYAPNVFDRAGAIAGASGFIGCGAAVTVPRQLIAEAIDVVVFITGRGTSRRIETIARVTGLEAQGAYALADTSPPPKPQGARP